MHESLQRERAEVVIAGGFLAGPGARGVHGGVPEGAAATADGTPTTDPELAEMPLPLGGAKGSGMSLLFELITSVLVGAPIVETFHSGSDRRHRQNALVIAIDPAALGDLAEFRIHVDATVDAIKSLPVAEGAEGIFVPGERSSAVAANRSTGGIPIAPKVWSAISAVADELGVAMPETHA